MKPRPYQQDAHDRAVEVMTRGARALIHLPTGTGKTIVLLLLAKSAPSDRPILLMAHMGQLLDQASAILESAGFLVLREQAESSHTPGSVEFQRRLNPGKRVIVCGSIATMKARRLKKWPEDFFGRIVIDEGHHAMAPGYRRLLAHFGHVQAALVTATPQRAGIQDLAEMAYSMPLGSPSVPGSAVGDGWLVPLRQRIVKIDGWDLRKLERPKGKNQDITDKAAQDFVRAGFLPMVRAIREVIGDKRAIIFVPGVALAEDVALWLSSALDDDEAELKRSQLIRDGIEESEADRIVGLYRQPAKALAIHGGTPKDPRFIGDRTRSEMLAMLEEWDPVERTGLQGLVNDSLLTEGVDIPGIEVIVIARMTRSTIRLMQMVGRGARPDRETARLLGEQETPEERRALIEDSKKPRCDVYLFSGEGAELDLATPARISADEWEDTGEPGKQAAIEEILDRILDESTSHLRSIVLVSLLSSGITRAEFAEYEQSLSESADATDLLEFAIETKARKELDKARREAQQAENDERIRQAQAIGSGDRAKEVAEKSNHSLQKVLTKQERETSIRECWDRYREYTIDEARQSSAATRLRVASDDPAAKWINPSFSRWQKRIPSEPQLRSKQQVKKHEERRIEAGSAMMRFLLTKGWLDTTAKATAAVMYRMASAWTLSGTTKERDYWQIQLGEREPWNNRKRY